MPDHVATAEVDPASPGATDSWDAMLHGLKDYVERG